MRTPPSTQRSRRKTQPVSEEDPDELWENQDPDETEEVLADLRSAIDLGHIDLSEWEAEFFDSIEDQFHQNIDRGKDRPLSGKQLVRLLELHKKLD